MWYTGQYGTWDTCLHLGLFGREKGVGGKRTHWCLLPLLIRCFSPDRMPGVSMMLMLSKTGLGSWAHINLWETGHGLVGGTPLPTRGWGEKLGGGGEDQPKTTHLTWV